MTIEELRLIFPLFKIIEQPDNSIKVDSGTWHRVFKSIEQLSKNNLILQKDHIKLEIEKELSKKYPFATFMVRVELAELFKTINDNCIVLNAWIKDEYGLSREVLIKDKEIKKYQGLGELEIFQDFLKFIKTKDFEKTIENETYMGEKIKFNLKKYFKCSCCEMFCFFGEEETDFEKLIGNDREGRTFSFSVFSGYYCKYCFQNDKEVKRIFNLSKLKHFWD